MTSILINLPVPPSVNNLFATAGKRRVTSKKYADWIEIAGWKLKSQRPGSVSGWYELFVFLPVKMPGDIGNREKALSDLLVKHGVIEDDKLAWSIRIARDHRVEGECQAVIRPVPDAERGI